MAKKGLVFLLNEYPKKEENFSYRQKYRFIPPFGKPIKTIIELEIHQNNICVISFYEHKKGTDKTKYQRRSNIGAGHTRAIFKACLQAYYKLEGDYALIFSASNDIDKKEEYNARYSAYSLFLSMYFKNYNDYETRGSIAINTLMIYHRSFQYKAAANSFYSEFEKKVEESINVTDNDSNKV